MIFQISKITKTILDAHETPEQQIWETWTTIWDIWFLAQLSGQDKSRDWFLLNKIKIIRMYE